MINNVKNRRKDMFFSNMFQIFWQKNVHEN